jgi:ArsR family transcriptional regulator
MDLAQFEAKAGEVAGMLKAVANQQRLMVLCKLTELGVASAGELAEAVDLS